MHSHNPSSAPLTKDEQAALEIINDNRALISTVADRTFDINGFRTSIDYTDIDKDYLDQIANPTLNRPSRTAYLFAKKSYQITSMSTSPLLDKPGVIEFKCTDKGFEYRLIGLDNKMKTDIIPWEELPKDFPRKDEDIFPPDPAYRIILQYTTRAGYTLENGLPLPAVLKKMNMRTLKVHDHKPGQNRVTKHKGEEYQYTAKTSTSLIPSDPRYMELFFCDNQLGLLWDINKCNIKKEKYVFATDGFTDDCEWIDLNRSWSGTEIENIASLTQKLQAHPLPTIASLRAQNNQAVKEQKSITWNELLVGLPKGKVDAVFATQDVRSSRLRAYRLMLHVLEKLNLPSDLPIFIIQPYYAEVDYTGEHRKVPNRSAVFRVYSKAEREMDLNAEIADKQLEQTSLDIIKNHRALALVVSDKTMLDQVLNQTENLSVSLLPPEPQWMELSANHVQIGIFWDIETCVLDKNSQEMIDSLREKNNNAVSHKQAINRNTLSAKLPQGKINGIFCLLDSSAARLQAYELMLYAKERLKLDTNIPVFIIQYLSPTFRLYSECQLVDDKNWQLWESVNRESHISRTHFFAQRKRREDVKDFVFVNHEDANADHENRQDEEDYVFVSSGELDNNESQSRRIKI